MSIEKIGVLGFGLMGAGIAQVAAQSGFQTTVIEIEQKFLEKGFSIIQRNLTKAVEKDKMTAGDKDKISARIKGTLNLSDLHTCDLIIEAVTEDPDSKKQMFSALDKICPQRTIFASNTSSLTIIEIAASTDRPDRFSGLHFFNPVPAMRLVEVIKTIATSKATVDSCFEFCKRIGKVPILAKDTSGFIVNRLLVPYLLDAVRVLEHGVASIIDIDTGMTLGLNYPMGPLTLLDFVGIDTTYKIANIMFEEYRETRFAPPPLLKKMVLAGYFGRKSGKGFYDYTKEKPEPNDLV